MSDKEEFSEVGFTANVAGGKRWQGSLVAVLLIIGGLLLGIKPKLLTLDWPSLVLVLGVLLLFIPLDDAGARGRKPRVRQNEILFRGVDKLRKEVTAAIKSAELKEASEIPLLTDFYAGYAGGESLPGGRRHPGRAFVL